MMKSQLFSLTAATPSLTFLQDGIFLKKYCLSLPVYEYTALQIKQAVVGQGKAAKEQVQHMVVRMLRLSGTPQADAADGLAAALTHALRNNPLAARLNPDGLQIKGGRFR